MPKALQLLEPATTIIKSNCLVEIVYVVYQTGAACLVFFGICPPAVATHCTNHKALLCTMYNNGC
jgi:hypothetical protein